MKSGFDLEGTIKLKEAKEVIVNEWLCKYEADALRNVHFQQHWAVWVSSALSPEHELNSYEPHFDQDTLNIMLLESLEDFIFNNSNISSKHIFDNYKHSSVCGKVMKDGDPIFRCQECGVDPTCVLCANCFNNSTHKNHRYKIGTSGGGGCCDCGDVLSWKKDPHCGEHLPGSNECNTVNLPVDLISRATLVVSAALLYCFEVLTLDPSTGLPFFLKVIDENKVGFVYPEDIFCTVLYNDEVHSFEQVANALTRVIKCSSVDAYSVATYIDKVGRAVLKYSSYIHCNDIVIDLERFTFLHNIRPLKVSVLQWHIIAHQMFSLRLLSWLENLMKQTKEFRDVVTAVGLNLNNDFTASCFVQGVRHSIVEGVILQDSKMWKAARLHWQSLFLSVILVDYENKKEFARIFTKYYDDVIKGFVMDDHDRTFSICCLSVQIFTVISIAHYLISEEDVISIVLKSFLSECYKLCNSSGKLVFNHTTTPTNFFRSLSLLSDLQYLLATPPQEWTHDLRKHFLKGVSVLLSILSLMQDMNSVTRQVGQHVEYEPEWRYDFRLQKHLTSVLSQVLTWCSTDQVVLLKAYRLILKKLFESPSPGLDNLDDSKCLAGHSVRCYQYDVSSQPVSIHLPLSRFFAGIYLHLQKYSFKYYSPEFNSLIKHSPEQLIEPVLRVQVLIGQVHAGMWKKNGNSLANQIYFYQNVSCRTEMLDKDVALLQIGASLIDSNEFLIHILNKFNLLNWASLDFEFKSSLLNDDTVKQIIVLSEHFLSLIIAIIGERYNIGIGKVMADDCLKYEIIHQLFVKPHSHSELQRALANNSDREIEMQCVINDVAKFHKPSNSQKGVYVVNQEESMTYNAFYYHYSPEDRSKSEEEQRKQRKALDGIDCCPPGYLCQFTEPFTPITNLLCSDVMLHIFSTVLSRFLYPNSRSFSEGQLHRILHLIGLALLEEENGCNVKFFIEAKKWNLDNLLEKLVDCKHTELHKSLIYWTLQKYRSFLSEPDNQAGKSISKDLDTINKNDVKTSQSKIAAERQAEVMAQMSALQQKFLKNNSSIFKDLFNEIDGSEVSKQESVITASLKLEKCVTCILCQEDHAISCKGPAMVSAAYIQKSTVLLKEEEKPTWLALFSLQLNPPIHVNTCGHIMHITCWNEYINLVHNAERQRPYRLRQPAAFDTGKNEYLCPLCKCLSNTILPVLPKTVIITSSVSFTDWLQTIRSICDEHYFSVMNEPYVGDLCQSDKLSMDDSGTKSMDDTGTKCMDETGTKRMDDTGTISIDGTGTNDVGTSAETSPCSNILDGPSDINQLFPIPTISEDSETFNFVDDMLDMADLFSTHLSVVNGRDISVNSRIFLVWQACAYTIRCLEKYLHFMNKLLLNNFNSRQEMCVENLIRLSALLSITNKNKFKTIEAPQRILFILLRPHESGWPNILQWDCFGLFISLMMTLPDLFCQNTGPIFDKNLLKLVLMLNFAQSISKVDMNDLYLERSGPDNKNDDGSESDNDHTKYINDFVTLFRDCKEINTTKVWNVMKTLSLPFLRCCAIFYYFFSGAEPTEALKNGSGNEFDNILNYLEISNECSELLNWSYAYDIYIKWALQPNINLLENLIIPNDFHVQLIDLPEDYCDLLNKASLFTCPNRKRNVRRPSMCLVCGDILCSDTYCCQKELDEAIVGPCTYHCNQCGDGSGIFLDIVECQILLLSSNPSRGSFMPAPYFDEYGEPDLRLHRGNPLHLCKEQYQNIQMLWLSHRVQEEISRAIEFSQAFISVQWNTL